MTEPTATPSAPRDPLDPAPTRPQNPVLAHPVTSAAIGVLVAAAILCTAIVPIYASVTPKVGDFPFFYFYLLVYMPATALVLWIAMLLQRRLKPRQPDDTGAAGTVGDPVPGGAR
jgi:Na+/melibiose symporter-like transporter